MDREKRIDTYKEFYFKELDERAALNNEVNTPVTVLALLVTMYAFVFTQELNRITLLILLVISVLNLATITVAMIYLIKVFSGFIKVQDYSIISGSDKFYRYWQQLSEVDRTDEFAIHLEEQLATSAGQNFEINRRRREDLATAKKWLSALIFLSLLFALVFGTSILLRKFDVSQPYPNGPTPVENSVTNKNKYNGKINEERQQAEEHHTESDGDHSANGGKSTEQRTTTATGTRSSN